jgi:two-component system, NarL family, response regulator DegU
MIPCCFRARLKLGSGRFTFAIIMLIKVLLADDERLFRQSLKILLETGTDLQVVAEAGDGQEAVTGARELKPDLALLDVDMPKMDGIKACRLIRTVSARTKILMLSVHHEEEKIRAAIRAGALGYILKDSDREEFIKIIRQTHAGRIPSSPYLAHLTLERAPNSEVAGNQDPQLFADRFALTEMELKILRLLIEGLSNEEIGQITRLASETIKGHLKALFRKLDVKNRTEAAVLAVRDGIG